MFYIRNIYLEEARVEAGKLDLVPTNKQGQAVCAVVTEFLKNRPPEFRDKLSFLKKGEMELDWSATPGGVALASLFESSEPASMGVLLTGVQPEADRMMLEVFRDNVLMPLFEGTPVEHINSLIEVTDRPLLFQVIFPGPPEWAPTVQLLSNALASVFFRTILAIESTSLSAPNAEL
jgi:hypothetical protein